LYLFCRKALIPFGFSDSIFVPTARESQNPPPPLNLRPKPHGEIALIQTVSISRGDSVCHSRVLLRGPQVVAGDVFERYMIPIMSPPFPITFPPLQITFPPLMWRELVPMNAATRAGAQGLGRLGRQGPRLPSRVPESLPENIWIVVGIDGSGLLGGGASSYHARFQTGLFASVVGCDNCRT